MFILATNICKKLMIEGYEISEKRIVTIHRDDKRLAFEVAFDFKVTKEWLDEQFDNPELSKCFNWLEKKGFVLNGNRWDLAKGEKNHHIRLPQCFMDFDNSRLRVSFGTVEAKSFYFPRPNKGYCSLKEFPLYLPEKCYTVMNNSTYNDLPMTWIDFTVKEAFDEYLTLKRDGSDIDSFYFQMCFDRLEAMKEIAGSTMGAERSIITDKGNRIERFFKDEESTLLKNQDFCNLKRSLESVSKFNL